MEESHPAPVECLPEQLDLERSQQKMSQVTLSARRQEKWGKGQSAIHHLLPLNQQSVENVENGRQLGKGKGTRPTNCSVTVNTNFWGGGLVCVRMRAFAWNSC